MRRMLIALALVAALAAGATLYAVLFIDEPLRLRTEANINAALKGYTVRISRLEFHPIGFSIDLKDSVIVQDAHPDRPIAEIPTLTASVNWLALLSGRVVADFEFDRPKIYIDLNQTRSELRDQVSLKERGWQEALQAIYPLKINQFRLVNGELTYVDDGPYRPLQLRGVNFRARNIRNIRSQPGQYPSDIHLDGRVFENGEVALDGHADFLAVPHVSFKADLDLRRIELDYFRPIIERYQFSLRKGVANAKGTIEYAQQRKIVAVPKIQIDGLVGDYIHAQSTVSPTAEIAKKTDGLIREHANSQTLEVRVDEIDIVDGELGVINRASQPGYRVFLGNARVNVKNLSNQNKDGVAVGTATGRFMGSGPTKIALVSRPTGKSPNFDLRLAIDQAEMKDMNRLFLAYGNFDVAAGQFSLYSEITVRDGMIDGYVKPLFRNVSVYDAKQDQEKSLPRRLYERFLGGMSWILENRAREEVATTTRISGQLAEPQTSTFEIVVGLIRNAFFQAVLPGLEKTDAAEPKGKPQSS